MPRPDLNSVRVARPPRRSHEHGQHHLTKPIDPVRLDQLLADFGAGSHADASSESGCRPRSDDLAMAPEDITQLLIQLRDGHRRAQESLLPLVYDQLRAMAHRRLWGGGPGRTLDTTELVHEAYLKLFDQTRLSVADRRHFFAVAAMAMRQIVVDHARRRRSLKRGGDFKRLELASGDLPVDDRAAEIVSLDEALRRLAEVDDRLARVVELRFFGGLSVEETAEVLEVNARTVKRDWRKARALLFRELSEPVA